MSEKPTFPRVYMLLTTACNLQCRDCCIWIPYYKKHWHPDTEECLRTIDRFFEVADWELFDFSGGELFLRNDLPHILAYFYDRHIHALRDYLTIVTNCSLPMSEALLHAITRFGKKIKVKLDHYGAFSPFFDEIHTALTAHDVWVEVHDYRPDVPNYCGGWAGTVLSEEIINTADESKAIFDVCSRQYTHISNYYMDGTIYPCGLVMACTRALGVNYDQELTIDFFREDIASIRRKLQLQLDAEILNTCRHCKGGNLHGSKRMTAAVQLSPEEVKTLTDSNFDNAAILTLQSLWRRP